MSSTRTQRVIALILLISPWIYLPTVIKEVIFIVLATILYLSTVPLYKKHKGDFDIDGAPAPQVQTHTHSDVRPHHQVVA